MRSALLVVLLVKLATVSRLTRCGCLSVPKTRSHSPIGP